MKYVESYWAEELPNGVIHLLINCKQREIWFHSFTDTEFLIAGTKKEYNKWTQEVVLKTEKFLPNNKDVIYIMSSVKEKDQVNFFWIPFERGKFKNRKILISSKP